MPANRKSILDNKEYANFVAFLGALCLFFATIEYLFPKPVPFFRLGLANLPVLIALEFFQLPTLLLLILLKVLGQGLVNGTLASYVFLFSAAGSFAAGLAMWAVHRGFGRHISLVGVSMFGAVASNVVQVVLSVVVIFGPSAWVITPVFLGLGTFAGLVVGVFAERFKEKSVWLAQVRDAYENHLFS